jgi:hypothetical protein
MTELSVEAGGIFFTFAVRMMTSTLTPEAA